MAAVRPWMPPCAMGFPVTQPAEFRSMWPTPNNLIVSTFRMRMSSVYCTILVRVRVSSVRTGTDTETVAIRVDDPRHLALAGAHVGRGHVDAGTCAHHKPVCASNQCQCQCHRGYCGPHALCHSPRSVRESRLEREWSARVPRLRPRRLKRLEVECSTDRSAINDSPQSNESDCERKRDR